MKASDEKFRIRIRNPVYGPKDPDPSQNVTDPEHHHKYVILVQETESAAYSIMYRTPERIDVTCVALHFLH